MGKGKECQEAGGRGGGGEGEEDQEWGGEGAERR